MFLTHISRRYHEHAVIQEARKYFPNSYVVRDLDHFAIFRDKLPEKVEKSFDDNDDDLELGE